jgi:hypothetical protein
MSVSDCCGRRVVELGKEGSGSRRPWSARSSRALPERVLSYHGPVAVPISETMGCSAWLGIVASEQLAERARIKQRYPTLPPVRGAIMGEVAALAECCEIARRVVTRVLIKVGGGEHDVGGGQGQGGTASSLRSSSTSEWKWRAIYEDAGKAD